MLGTFGWGEKLGMPSIGDESREITSVRGERGREQRERKRERERERESERARRRRWCECAISIPHSNSAALTDRRKIDRSIDLSTPISSLPSQCPRLLLVFLLRELTPLPIWGRSVARRESIDGRKSVGTGEPTCICKSFFFFLFSSHRWFVSLSCVCKEFVTLRVLVHRGTHTHTHTHTHTLSLSLSLLSLWDCWEVCWRSRQRWLLFLAF
jgi:hypothetical protein